MPTLRNTSQHVKLVRVGKPLEIDTGRTPRVRTHDEEITSGSYIPLVDYAKYFSEDRQRIITEAKKNLLAAQERMKQYYDTIRRDMELQVGDYVYLDTKNISIQHVNENTLLRKAKLSARKIGPFKIESMINANLAKLKLPSA
ncbi:hypothetical protein P43SY_010486 [Pythium insidiosum]|uniref:Tf2-1-like SH3-like domain-containing protein n=1 Tax=Pythium insidiosum TaxID=114742 RepID=A0AAD5LT74_PYTIN|nr:hypothetical protein P43SY_010486 [Pythium insidiosum]